MLQDKKIEQGLNCQIRLGYWTWFPFILFPMVVESPIDLFNKTIQIQIQIEIYNLAPPHSIAYENEKSCSPSPFPKRGMGRRLGGGADQTWVVKLTRPVA